MAGIWCGSPRRRVSVRRRWRRFSNPFVCSPTFRVSSQSLPASATPRVLVTLESPEYLPQYLNHSDHQAVGGAARAPAVPHWITSAGVLTALCSWCEYQQGITGLMVVKPMLR